MEIDHAAVVAFAKSFGLFYLIGLSIAVVAHAYWPSNRTRFERAADAILVDEDAPWR